MSTVLNWLPYQKLPETPDPLDMAQKVSQLRSMSGQQQLQQQQLQQGDLTIQEKTEEMAARARINRVLAGDTAAPAGTDPAGTAPVGAAPVGAALPSTGNSASPSSGQATPGEVSPATGAPGQPTAPANSASTRLTSPDYDSLVKAGGTWALPLVKTYSELAQKRAETQKTQLESSELTIQHQASVAGAIAAAKDPTTGLTDMNTFSTILAHESKDPVYGQQAQQLGSRIMSITDPAARQKAIDQYTNSTQMMSGKYMEAKAALMRGQSLMTGANTKFEDGQWWDLSGGQPKPIGPSMMTPLTPEMAQFVGKNPGDQVPISVAKKIKESMGEGIIADTAHGSSILVDKTTGKEVANLGTATPILAANIQTPHLTNEALDMNAQRFLETGQLPSLGMRGAVAQAAIINRAAELSPSAPLAYNSAQYKSNLSSLTNVTRTLDTLSGFEMAANKNLDAFETLVSKLPDTGVPWLNTPVRLLNEKLVGSEYMPAVSAARDVALREIARVTNDPKLNGVLSDSARHEVQALIGKDATIGQIKQAAQILRNDMNNVHTSLNQQRDVINNRIHSTSGVPTGPNGGKVQVIANGQTITLNSQADADAFKAAASARGIKVE